MLHAKQEYQPTEWLLRLAPRRTSASSSPAASVCTSLDNSGLGGLSFDELPAYGGHDTISDRCVGNVCLDVVWLFFS